MTWLPAVRKGWLRQVTGEGAPLVIVVTQNGLPATSSESLKDTVPDGGAAVTGEKVAPLLAVKVTVAVRVTCSLTCEGFFCEATVVVVGSAETVWFTLELLVLKFVSPL